MRATKIEIRTKALRAGRTVNGVWEPAGQLVATLWIEEPQAYSAAQIACQILHLDGEEVVAEVVGRMETPTE
jgi:hypothetical protein